MEEDSEKAKAWAVPIIVRPDKLITIPNPIEKGDIVEYKDKFYRVRACFKTTVNLGGIFGSTIYFKKVPRSEVTEANAKWYAHWQESETYKCM
jgi:hypothetical protein